MSNNTRLLDKLCVNKGNEYIGLLNEQQTTIGATAPAQKRALQRAEASLYDAQPRWHAATCHKTGLILRWP